MLRKKLPYDIEIDVQADRIGVVNHTEWLTKELKIQYLSSTGHKGGAILRSDGSEVVIKDLIEGDTYEIRISRNDIKGLRYRPKILKVVTGKKPYIVLIGASVGYAWNLPIFPQRVGDDRFVVGFRRGKDGFDKTLVLLSLLTSEIKPDVIIIKECAAYFPRDAEKSIEMIDKWVRMIKENNIIPVLATVAPITKEVDLKRPGIQNSINNFNELIRSYAFNNNIEILDLQRALEDGSEKKFQKREYALKDGLHIKEKTYRNVLDPVFYTMLTSLFKEDNLK